MKFTPDYTVSYKGTFYPAGKAFPIDAKDKAEMERHGTVEAQAPKRTGRPRKAADEE